MPGVFVEVPEVLGGVEISEGDLRRALLGLIRVHGSALGPERKHAMVRCVRPVLRDHNAKLLRDLQAAFSALGEGPVSQDDIAAILSKCLAPNSRSRYTLG